MAGLLDDPIGFSYSQRDARKGHKVVRPVYGTEVALTRRLLRDCKLKAALERLVREAVKRLRRNHNALKREERHPDERAVVGEVIGAMLTNVEVWPLVEVPKDHKEPMCIDVKEG